VRAAAHAAYADATGGSLTFDGEDTCDELYDSGHALNVALSSIKVSKEEAPPDIRNNMGKDISLLGALTELNDHEGWSRESIADWLESSGLDATVEESILSDARIKIEV
jgi:hypothetical protein